MPPTEGSVSSEWRDENGKTEKELRIEQWKKKEELRRNTWDAMNVTDVISDSADMISIVSLRDPYVEDSEPFRASIHKELLCYYSAHYSSVLKGKSIEAKKGTINVNLSCLQAHNLVRWLYTGTLELEETDELLHLYVFTDKKETLALRRSIMSIIIEGHELCGLFHYIVDLWACKWIQDGDSEDTEYYDEAKSIPRVFFYRALRKLVLMVDEKDACMAALKVLCNYHEHPSVSEWEATCHDKDFSCSKPNDDYYEQH